MLCSFTLPKKGDGKIAVNYLRHKLNSKYIFRVDENLVRVFLRCRADDVSKAFLVLVEDGKEKKISMKEIGSTRGKQYFYVDFVYQDRELEYYFLLKDGSISVGFRDEEENFKYNLKDFKPNKFEDFNSLFWYQIDVDKFRKGSAENIDSVAWNISWAELTEEEKAFKQKNSWYDMPYFRRYGGDLQGIIEKLDYLQDLGVDVILLNPVFFSKSSNKLEVADHFYISPDIATGSKKDYEVIEKRSGTSESDNLFKSLLDEAHDRGIKVVIEFPLHTGKDHFAYKDIEEKGKESLFYDWYVHEDDANSGNIVMLNHNNLEVKEYLLNSLIKFRDMGLDGIIVSSLQDREILNYIRDNSDIFVCALPLDYSEVFEDLDSTDAIFNLRSFADILTLFSYFSSYNSSSLRTTLSLNTLRYPDSFIGSIVSPISTIDTERALSSFINIDEINTRAQENKNYKLIKPSMLGESAEKKLQLTLILLATYPGSFMIAYGDEAGMWGASDPDSRKPMIWGEIEPYDRDYDVLSKYPDPNFKDVDNVNDLVFYSREVDRDIYNFFSSFMSLRKEKEDIFKYGELIFPPLPQDVSGEVLVYYRKFRDRAAVIVVNLSNSRQKFNLPLPFKGTYVDPLSKKNYDNIVGIDDFEIDSKSAVVLFAD